MGKIVEIGGEKYYVGLDAIAKRLGWKCGYTVRRHILQNGLLAIKGHVPGSHQKRGQVWYTNDSLLHAWQIGQAKVSRDGMKKQKIATWPDRRYWKRHAAREKAKDTRAVIGPNGNQPSSKPEPLNPRGRPRLDDEDVTC